MYDVLIVGSGLFGSTLANLLSPKKKVLVVERNSELGGVVHSDNVEGIEVHSYGAHIFRTNDDAIWNYVNSIVEFIPFINSPITISNGEVFNLPFNMNTFSKLWGIKFPDEAKKIIAKQIEQVNLPNEIDNLEDFAISQVGIDIYSRFIKGYTEKQWGKKCSELPKSIIKRVPLRFTYDNNYSNTKYQGIPKNGYTDLINKLLCNIDYHVNTDGKRFIKDNHNIAKTIVYTGMIDEYYDYQFGKLEYRSLRFEHTIMPTSNYQGNAVVNYADAHVPYTRTIEHCHFTKEYKDRTVLTFEYPVSYIGSNTPYYPIETKRNLDLYAKYVELSNKTDNIIFAGRLGSYSYVDMDTTIKNAMLLADKILMGG